MELIIENVSDRVKKVFKDFIKSAYKNPDETYTIVLEADDFQLKHIEKEVDALITYNMVLVSLKRSSLSIEYLLLYTEFTRMTLL